MYYVLGVYIIIQTGDLVQVWGDLTLMTASVFMLFTNIAYAIQLAYVIQRRELIQKIIFDGDNELDGQKTKLAIQTVERLFCPDPDPDPEADPKTTQKQTGRPQKNAFYVFYNRYRKDTIRLVTVYFSVAFSSVFGITFSGEKDQLPLRAWYPFDATKRPAYQWTYAYTILFFIALSINAAVNLCCDVLVAALIAQCRCRLRLIAQSLRTLCDDVDVDKKGRITADSEKVVGSRVRSIVMRHQLVLAQVEQLQQCFSVPILGQFAVASFIICVTAYQMAFVTNLYRLISMASFEIAVTIQVYIYCVAGTNLTIDSDEVSRAAYECPWYECPASIRRLLLVIMVRCKRATVITVAGIVEISLDTFMSIMKASYTFFTVLQSTGEL
ncbi:odorant receptor 94a-like [Danaus plexippus]|uniref:odorant receptor 94a-like n=1 Tax=Danaus plexippus TaxID=13037 RepID=UPI002AB23DD4|nr:odorant receptor 94a-like [Danaus plexippus]